jgi:hypothetical protein
MFGGCGAAFSEKKGFLKFHFLRKFQKKRDPCSFPFGLQFFIAPSLSTGEGPDS